MSDRQLAELLSLPYFAPLQPVLRSACTDALTSRVWCEVGDTGQDVVLKNLIVLYQLVNSLEDSWPAEDGDAQEARDLWNRIESVWVSSASLPPPGSYDCGEPGRLYWQRDNLALWAARTYADLRERYRTTEEVWACEVREPESPLLALLLALVHEFVRFRESGVGARGLVHGLMPAAAALYSAQERHFAAFRDLLLSGGRGRLFTDMWALTEDPHSRKETRMDILERMTKALAAKGIPVPPKAVPGPKHFVAERSVAKYAVHYAKVVKSPPPPTPGPGEGDREGEGGGEPTENGKDDAGAAGAEAFKEEVDIAVPEGVGLRSAGVLPPEPTYGPFRIDVKVKQTDAAAAAEGEKPLVLDVVLHGPADKGQEFALAISDGWELVSCRNVSRRLASAAYHYHPRHPESPKHRSPSPSDEDSEIEFWETPSERRARITKYLAQHSPLNIPFTVWYHLREDRIVEPGTLAPAPRAAASAAADKRKDGGKATTDSKSKGKGKEVAAAGGAAKKAGPTVNTKWPVSLDISVSTPCHIGQAVYVEFPEPGWKASGPHIDRMPTRKRKANGQPAAAFVETEVIEISSDEEEMADYVCSSDEEEIPDYIGSSSDEEMDDDGEEDGDEDGDEDEGDDEDGDEDEEMEPERGRKRTRAQY